jgi:hypothetical protein
MGSDVPQIPDNHFKLASASDKVKIKYARQVQTYFPMIAAGGDNAMSWRELCSSGGDDAVVDDDDDDDDDIKGTLTVQQEMRLLLPHITSMGLVSTVVLECKGLELTTEALKQKIKEKLAANKLALPWPDSDILTAFKKSKGASKQLANKKQVFTDSYQRFYINAITGYQDYPKCKFDEAMSVCYHSNDYLKLGFFGFAAKSHALGYVENIYAVDRDNFKKENFIAHGPVFGHKDVRNVLAHFVFPSLFFTVAHARKNNKDEFVKYWCRRMIQVSKECSSYVCANTSASEIEKEKRPSSSKEEEQEELIKNFSINNGNAIFDICFSNEIKDEFENAIATNEGSKKAVSEETMNDLVSAHIKKKVTEHLANAIRSEIPKIVEMVNQKNQISQSPMLMCNEDIKRKRLSSTGNDDDAFDTELSRDGEFY